MPARLLEQPGGLPKVLEERRGSKSLDLGHGVLFIFIEKLSIVKDYFPAKEAARMLSYGEPHPTRVGYYLVGFCRSYWHKKANKRVYPKHGRAFPIWRKCSTPPPVQLKLI